MDETLAALSECLDFLRAARGSDESDREKEAAHVAQLLSSVLGDDAQRAQLLATLVDALTSRAQEEEDEEDALLVESVAQGADPWRARNLLSGRGALTRVCGSDRVRLLREPHVQRRERRHSTE